MLECPDALAAIVAAAHERLRAKLSYTNIGFALAPAADVRTLALVEVVFAAAVSRRRREAMGRRELAGMALVVAGVAWLLRAA